MNNLVPLCTVLLTIIELSASFRMVPMRKSAFNSCRNVIALNSDVVERTVPLDKEHLIDEEMVTDDLSASLLADRLIANIC